MNMIHWLPRSFFLKSGRLCGSLVYLLSARHRRLAHRNLAAAYGKEKSFRQYCRIARQSFTHFGGALADFFYIGSLPPNKRSPYIRLNGGNFLKKALSEKKGVLIFTAHFGFWEMASSPISRYARLWVIARPMDNAGLERSVSRLRKNMGAQVISKTKAGKKVLRVLRNREMAAILIDQNVLREESVFVDFFGKTASTTPALAAFHLRTKAPVVPVFCRLTEQNIYQVDIHPPMDFSYSGDYKTDVKNITQACTKIIEKEIRKYPGQWLWFHDRWRSRPDSRV